MPDRPQPVSTAGAISIVLTSGIALLAILWPGYLTPEATAAIVVFGNAVIGLGAIVYAKGKVTPVSSPMLAVGTPVLLPDQVKGETPAASVVAVNEDQYLGHGTPVDSEYDNLPPPI